MVVLNESVLDGRGDPGEEIIKGWLIRGEVEEVENKQKEAGWSGHDPIFSLGLVIDSQGNIVGTKAFLLGYYPVGKIKAAEVLGDKFGVEDYLKVNTVDMSNFTFEKALVSDWLSGGQLEWTLKVKIGGTTKIRPSTQSEPEKLAKEGGNQMSFRLHLSLIKGLKVEAKLGVAPVDNISAKVGNAKLNFPIIQMGKAVKATMVPAEEGTDYGLGFLPYIIYQGEGIPEVPGIANIRNAMSSFLNSGIKAKSHLKFQTWRESSAMGHWDEIFPAFSWPTYDEDRMEGEVNFEFNLGLVRIWERKGAGVLW